jgi:acetyl-CoA carboxylase biotin carboxyl carrier protein
MDLKELGDLLEILAANEITEFELEEEGRTLRIRKAGSAPAAPPAVLVPTLPVAPGAVPAAGPAAPSARPVVPAPAAREPEEESGLAVVKSPIVGTFYRTPDPNSPPFVNVGDRVRVGQVLCIIEAMKLMNEIEAEVAGEVVRIHHESGQPVQYGEPLFTIRP